jgi:hypothetical protein
VDSFNVANVRTAIPLRPKPTFGKRLWRCAGSGVVQSLGPARPRTGPTSIQGFFSLRRSFWSRADDRIKRPDFQATKMLVTFDA